MKKGLVIIALSFVFLNGFSQTKSTKKNDKKIDTVKTEVVEVVSTYNPKITDANKIRKNPVVELLNKSKKKKLNYTIFSAPVASTFIPKSGVVKGIDVGVKERIYDNYVALGYGNYNSPFTEVYLHSNNRFQDQFGLHAKYSASLDNIENTLLDSNFSNFMANVFYKKEERYFDWKVNLLTELDSNNWYGLSNTNFNDTTLNAIEENQNYKYFKAAGEIDFLDAYLDNSTLSISHFSDAFESQEFLVNLNTNFDFPMDFISRNANNLTVNTNLEYLSGQFATDYSNQNRLNYTIITAKINPEYNTTFIGFKLKIGTSFFASFDTENKINNFLLYPDVRLQKPFAKERFSIYTGVKGGLNTNTFKGFTDDNPFVSPTIFITQTSEKYNAFVGFTGLLNNNFSFNFSARIIEEEDKPLFIKNNSKSDGTTTIFNGNVLNGYEYGNSFNVVYDDVKTTSFLAEAEYSVNQKLSISSTIEYQNFTMTNEQEAWNLPNFEGSLSAKYKEHKWYASANVFFVGDRKERDFNTIYPATFTEAQNVDGFVDLNFNGGYLFTNQFSVFLKLNNVLNNNYQQFANFDVQGFQVLGGITYKFDF